MLSENQLWERIRRLEGQTVYTLEQRRPNRVSRVTNERVEIEERATSPTREDIFEVYRQLHQRGEITGEILYGTGSILGHPYAKKMGRIYMAVLAAVVPEEIDVITRSRTERLSGIRLRN